MTDETQGEMISPQAVRARRRADQIRDDLKMLASYAGHLAHLLNQAIEDADWQHLGYESIGDYVCEEFGDTLKALGTPENRAYLVPLLREHGLKRAEVAEAMGLTERRVQQISNPKPQLTYAEARQLTDDINAQAQKIIDNQALLAKLQGDDPDEPEPLTTTATPEPREPPAEPPAPKPRKTGPVVDEIQPVTAEYEVLLSMRENDNTYTVTVTVTEGDVEGAEGEVSSFETASGEEPSEGMSERLIEAAIQAVISQHYPASS